MQFLPPWSYARLRAAHFSFSLRFFCASNRARARSSRKGARSLSFSVAVRRRLAASTADAGFGGTRDECLCQKGKNWNVPLERERSEFDPFPRARKKVSRLSDSHLFGLSERALSGTRVKCVPSSVYWLLNFVHWEPPFRTLFSLRRSVASFWVHEICPSPAHFHVS